MTRHSFGGSALDRHVFDFDTDDGIGDGGLGTPPPDPALGGDPAGGDPGSWSMTQDEWTTFQQQQAELAQTVRTLAELEAARAQPYLQPQQQGNQVPMPDPWNRPDTYEDDLRAWGESLVAPFQQRFENLDQQDGQERLADVVSDLEAQHGEFFAETRDAMHALTLSRARELYPQYAARMGNGDPAAEAALEAAFGWAKEIESKIASNGITRHTNEIATLAGATLPPGSSYSEGHRVRAVPNWLEDRRTIAQKLMDEAG